MEPVNKLETQRRPYCQHKEDKCPNRDVPEQSSNHPLNMPSSPRTEQGWDFCCTRSFLPSTFLFSCRPQSRSSMAQLALLIWPHHPQGRVQIPKVKNPNRSPSASQTQPAGLPSKDFGFWSFEETESAEPVRTYLCPSTSLPRWDQERSGNSPLPFFGWIDLQTVPAKSLGPSPRSKDSFR